MPEPGMPGAPRRRPARRRRGEETIFGRVHSCRCPPAAREIAAKQHDFSAMKMVFRIMKSLNAAMRKNFSIREIDFYNTKLNIYVFDF
ncbi:hypothetical protein HNP33_001737 [Comamonas odontotermitis]|uniref:Uncharacterized protein n=1 Tax=Comamonas odontotermitis TaxID=379895 RepID=A0ABR6REV2_9BURK|nr:hypothetical protein [Comamonas odontotermitis]MBB6577680.1 hypothetical protein [Comamonas odontotermitis]